MMAGDPAPEDSTRVYLRRYPNRRYYDAARSQHLTLEDIFRLIGDGRQVQISESKTGEDITARVLTQLILEQAPGKLAALPAGLLHEIIRSNESVLREFIDKYFNRALSAFLESQQELDRYLRVALGLANPGLTANGHGAGEPALNPAFPFSPQNWASMMGPFAPAAFVRAIFGGGADAPNGDPGPQPDSHPVHHPSSDVDDEKSDMRKTVMELKQQVEAIRKELSKA
jgi:polyhydroxyalkanoate synthesis repressor PhaR